MDLDTAEGRFAASQQLSTAAYNRAMADHIAKSVIETVNGHGIRPVQTRFGRLFHVGTTGSAFRTIDQAREFASAQPVLTPQP
jgi:hypothetical protein